MTDSGSEKAIVISALIVLGVYTYRRITEGVGQITGSPIPQVLGKGSPPPLGVFVTAWGFTFLMISIVAAAAPGLGGAFAILVATGDVLGNGTQVAKDINTKVSQTKTPAKGATP